VQSDKHRAFRVSFEFQTLSGGRQTGRYDVHKSAPAVGALVPVVYHRDQPEWNAAYPLKLVTPIRRR